jgi:hypothetical protein
MAEYGSTLLSPFTRSHRAYWRHKSEGKRYSSGGRKPMCCSSLEYCLIGIIYERNLSYHLQSVVLLTKTLELIRIKETKTGDNLTKARTASIRAKKRRIELGQEPGQELGQELGRELGRRSAEIKTNLNYSGKALLRVNQGKCQTENMEFNR